MRMASGKRPNPRTRPTARPIDFPRGNWFERPSGKADRFPAGKLIGSLLREPTDFPRGDWLGNWLEEANQKGQPISRGETDSAHGETNRMANRFPAGRPISKGRFLETATAIKLPRGDRFARPTDFPRGNWFERPSGKADRFPAGKSVGATHGTKLSMSARASSIVETISSLYESRFMYSSAIRRT